MRCTLTASVDGDPAPLHALLAAVEGSGFVDWPDIDPRSTIEHTIGLLLRNGAHGGAGSYEEARRVAARLAENLEHRIEAGRRAVELGHVVALDLARIRPVPRAVLLRGYGGGGRDWLLEHWGVDAPLSRVELRVRTEIHAEKRGRGRPRAGDVRRSWTTTRATWTFEASAFPWPCFRRLLGVWPMIEFGVAFQDGDGERFEKTWAPVEALIAKRAA
jgi:hypothetical protein